MSSNTSNLENVAQLIHLAAAPIFLLSALATTLLVLAGRLARIVDRGRALELRDDPSSHRSEMLLLERRAHMIYRSLFLGVTAALFVCLLMTLAFAGELFKFNPARAVAGLFMAALFAYTGALIGLLREVFLAVGGFRLRIHAPEN
ncbi:MAG: DUF2721 domain-containing protein [Elusimicrobiota bacterium]